ncbi:SITE-1 protease [Euphorbia peplus]|nr:SITE-1 protease [Euphorbia peplus]
MIINHHRTLNYLPLKFAIFIPLFALLAFHFRTPSPQTLTLTGGTQNQTRGGTRFIVRFKEYRKVEDHREYLESGVQSDGWRWIERRNPAMKYATDFGVVEIEEPWREVVIGEIEKLGIVKDVNVDLSYKRDLLGRNDGGSSGSSDYVNEKKRPGKMFTSMSFSEGEDIGEGIDWGRHLLMQKSQITSLFGAEALWSKGHTGTKVKMAIFDTGIRSDHPHFRNIKERTNWTNEDTLNDNLGHGTFVAGVVAGQDSECLGFAPDTEIYAFRVFTDAQVSYTSWFLDAFNYAIATHMDVLNLSIGGPDYLDLPFVEKVWEITANNIIMVSAIGNDGPLYGTLNNPADQSDVIGVGGIDYSDHMAPFSSRGMSTWELPHGYGRVKPDIVAYGRDIMGSKISTGCKSLSGTSVASPVVAGVVCLLVSVIPEESRKTILNPASMKQALVEGAAKLTGPNMYEQGAGRVDLLESYEILKNYQPRASIFPSVLDFSDCPYSWPFCRQPLYADIIWPWTGYLALHMQIKEEGTQFSGEIEGNVTLTVYSPPAPGEKGPRKSTCALHLKLKVVPTPARSKRILWDQFHSIKYPPGYIPRDSLDVRNDILDWHGDHLHTNFHIMFNMLRDAGYYVETLGSPFTCFDARQYGTLLLVDLEDEYFEEEIEKLRNDVISTGLGLAVFAEWYNVDTMVKMRFFDDNTRSWWTPVTGGANVPALNDLLAPFGIAFGDKILNGDYSIDGEQSRYASGTDIVRFPRGGYVHKFPFLDSSESGATQNVLSSGMNKGDSPILGLVGIGEGRIGVYGDSNCLDSSHMVTNCYWLLKKILDFTSGKITDPLLFSESVKQNTALYIDDNQLPTRRTDVNFSSYSAVVRRDLLCRSDSRFEVWGTKGYDLHVMGRNKRLPGYPFVDLVKGFNTTADASNLRRPKVTEKSNGDSLGNSYWSMLYGDELEVPVLFANHWLIHATVVIAGIVLLLSIWRYRQRRRRKRRLSGSGRLSNL